MKQSNYNFFMQADLSCYVGQWIAICSDKIVSHGKDLKKVFNEVKTKCPADEPLITWVPDDGTMIF